ncbi:hypothetical protein SASPL_102427 [Salvia splendens]|uniref:Uncharacterized protein n=1 Tax=Salvia splendens TaxID=180675 RepID=A0A8X8YSK1_SALSN|nr:hypothetical protein SASPL_102427 [Salvia splendens]
MWVYSLDARRRLHLGYSCVLLCVFSISISYQLPGVLHVDGGQVLLVYALEYNYRTLLSRPPKMQVDVKRSMEEGEKKFNQLSIEERGKFDEETLVNVNNIKKKSSTVLRAGGFSNEYIVITILVAAEGDHKLPSINNSKDLKEALQKLASIPSSRTMAVEVLWTPQNEDDTLSERELLEDYPLLRPL